MLVGLGAALYASGAFGAAARRLCEASDLKPADPTPYLYLGKMEKVSPTPLPCAEQKLARFAAEQPENALANYYYAMTLWKREKGSEKSKALQQAQVIRRRSICSMRLALGSSPRVVSSMCGAPSTRAMRKRL